MIEIALAFALGIIMVVLCLPRYRFPILVIASVFIGIAYLVFVAFVCIPRMMEALEAYERQNPDTLHAYAMIVGAFGLIGAAYYFLDRYRKKSGPQDAARRPLDSVKE